MKKFMVYFSLVMILFGAVLLAAGKPEDQMSKKAVKAVEKGNAAMQENKLDKALQYFQEALKLEPEYAQAYAGLGSLYNKQNKTDEALQNFEKAIQLNPDMKNCIVEYSSLLDRLSKTDKEKRITYLLKLVDVPGIEKIDKKFFYTLFFQIGAHFLSQNDIEKSNSYFQKVLQMTENQPDVAEFHANANYMMGMNLNRTRKYNESNPFMKKYVDLSQGNANAAQFVANATYIIGINNYELINIEADKIRNEPMAKEKEAKIAQLEKQREQVIRTIGGNRKQKLDAIDGNIQMIKNEDILQKKDRIAKLALASQADIEPYFKKAAELSPMVAEDSMVRMGNYYYMCKNLPQAVEQYKTIVEKFSGSQDIQEYKKFLENLEKELKAAEGKKEKAKP